MSLFLALAEILFIGDGRMESDVARLVEAGLNQMGGSVSAAVDTIPRAPLEYNLATPTTASDNNAKPRSVEAIAELDKGETRALILSEGVPLQTMIQWHSPAKSAATYAAIARAANPDVRVFYTETWHSLQSGEVVDLEADPGSDVPWRDRIELDRDIWRAIAAKASQDPFAGQIDVIPVGQALGRLSDEIEAGKVPGIADISELFRDELYTTGRGAYFVAMVDIAVLTGQSPEGLPTQLLRSWPSRDWLLTDEQARIFQRVAWEEVQAFQALAPLDMAEPVALPSEVAAVTAADPAADLPPGPVPDVINLPAVTNPNLFVGLAGVADWSTQLPFLDLMKSARPWIGHLPDGWGAWGYDELQAAGTFDANGWPISIPPELTGISTLVLTDMPPEAQGVRGRYVLRYKGQGSIKVEGIGRQVANVPGQIIFDFEPKPGFVLVTIDVVDPTDPIRDITIVREDRVAAHDAGEIFNPDWIARLRGVKGLRFMDWMMTNDSTQSRFSDRPLPTDYTWTAKGIPLEIMIALSNTLDAEPWFTLPHLADDDYVRRFAEMVRDGVESDRRVWVEFSNEVWNWQFQQANWAEEQAKQRWGEEFVWVQFYALRASEVAAIWTDVFGTAADQRLVRVVGAQPGYLGPEEQILDAKLVMGEGKPAPAKMFDALAITGYFAGNLGRETNIETLHAWIDASIAEAKAAAQSQGLTGDDATKYVKDHQFDAAFARVAEDLRKGRETGTPEDTIAWTAAESFPHHAKVAKDHGLELVMYEGGTHIVGLDATLDDPLLTDFFTAFNYSPQVADMYREIMQAWAKVSDAPFTQYVDVTNPTKWGSWGAMRHLGDMNPRWEALATGCGDC